MFNWMLFSTKVSRTGTNSTPYIRICFMNLVDRCYPLQRCKEGMGKRCWNLQGALVLVVEPEQKGNRGKVWIISFIEKQWEHFEGSPQYLMAVPWKRRWRRPAPKHMPLCTAVRTLTDFQFFLIEMRKWFLLWFQFLEICWDMWSTI